MFGDGGAVWVRFWWVLNVVSTPPTEEVDEGDKGYNGNESGGEEVDEC